MPELPQKRYLRRGAIRSYLGIDDPEMTKLVSAGVFTPKYLLGQGRAYFERAEVIAAEESGRIFKPNCPRNTRITQK